MPIWSKSAVQRKSAVSIKSAVQRKPRASDKSAVQTEICSSAPPLPLTASPPSPRKVVAYATAPARIAVAQRDLPQGGGCFVHTSVQFSSTRGFKQARFPNLLLPCVWLPSFASLLPTSPYPGRRRKCGWVEGVADRPSFVTGMSRSLEQRDHIATERPRPSELLLQCILSSACCE